VAANAVALLGLQFIHSEQAGKRLFLRGHSAATGAVEDLDQFVIYDHLGQ